VPVDFRIDDVVRLRKPHPCGGFDWTVVRLGADIGLRCTRCSHRIMLPRTDLERGMRSFVSRAEVSDPFEERDTAERPASVEPERP